MPEPLVRLQALEKSYGRAAPVLRGVDLAIGAEERVALIGANGSGKTTLLKSIIGLHPISGGSVEVMGERFTRAPVASQRSRLRRQTGFVFQKHCLVRRRSVLSNVVHGMLGAPGSWRAFAQSIAPEAWRARAMEMLAEVGLADRAMERADALSGGQQQRVAIARALVRQPRLLIADEPAASLDPSYQRDMMELFARLCREHGVTLVFTSHDMGQAREFAHRVVALKQGRILIDRPSAEISDAELEEVFHAA